MVRETFTFILPKIDKHIFLCNSQILFSHRSNWIQPQPLGRSPGLILNQTNNFPDLIKW